MCGKTVKTVYQGSGDGPPTPVNLISKPPPTLQRQRYVFPLTINHNMQYDNILMSCLVLFKFFSFCFYFCFCLCFCFCFLFCFVLFCFVSFCFCFRFCLVYLYTFVVVVDTTILFTKPYSRILNKREFQNHKKTLQTPCPWQNVFFCVICSCDMLRIKTWCLSRNTSSNDHQKKTCHSSL